MQKARHPRVPVLASALLPVVLLGCPGGSTQAPGGGEAEASLATALAHGDSAFRDEDYDEAQVAYEHALQIEPDHARAVAALGTCYLKNRQVKKASDLLTDHLRRHPENTAARLVLARALLRQAEYGLAAEALRAALRSDPDNLMAHYNLGFIAYRERDFDTALSHLKRAIVLRPDHVEAHYTLGLVYLARERYGDSVAELEEAVRLDPKHVGAHFNLANAAARAGRMPLAEEHQRIYADLSGRTKADAERSAQVKAQSVKAVEFLMAEKYDQALVEYRKLLAENPDYAPLHNDIGRVQLKLGQKQEALESLRRAIAIDPRLSEPHYLLSNLYRDLGDQAGADRELATFAALETIPEGKSGY
ncbi:MAG TPA: tetratricopeptide repeat protein [Candidatus Cryosericum sp.]|nr:tetratricopeptide repeat protein [Candidatus Cryosericum sp.]